MPSEPLSVIVPLVTVRLTLRTLMPREPLLRIVLLVTVSEPVETKDCTARHRCC